MLKRSLKAKNLKFLIPILLTNILLIGILISPNSKLDIPLLRNLYSLPLKAEIAFAPIIILFCLLINALIPSNLKALIIFWRIDALPGHRAFSHWVFSDSRINVDALRSKLGGFPDNPKSQNSLWYNLLKKHEPNIAVKEAHQHFLLFRDAASMVLIMLMIFSVTIFFYELNIHMAKPIFSMLLGEYLILMIAARNMANGLVKNVLSLESNVTSK
ncbi:hypothetical protein B6N58_13670 [Legionella micdadei]|uniref:hypothetical protein n=1 Tax=Legionella micdadei TaxID=451 RepID=UPI0009EF7BD1|nr:hypothetical protein [Legionella micdadei]ARG98621.1 hypothetical protein B6N58_13670 [Legionella micdadei]